MDFRLGLGFRLELCFGSRHGLESSERFAGDSDDRIAILIVQLVGGIQSLAHLRRNISYCLAQGVLGVVPRTTAMRSPDRDVLQALLRWFDLNVAGR